MGKGKSQLFRRKSELPHDIVTMAALDKHKRNDFLTINTNNTTTAGGGGGDSSTTTTTSTTTANTTTKT